jgi:hypothetical protein
MSKNIAYFPGGNWISSPDIVEKLMSQTSLFNLASENATMVHTNLTTGDLESIMREHHIPAIEWREWSELVFQHKRPGAELLYRIHHAANYMAAFNSILDTLSKQVKHKFPPKPTCRKAS